MSDRATNPQAPPKARPPQQGAWLLAAAALVGCGTRTGLPLPTSEPAEAAGGGSGGGAGAGPAGAPGAAPVYERFRCAFGPQGDDTRPALAAIVNDALLLARESGHTDQAMQVPIDETMAPQTALLAARGDAIAAGVLVTPKGATKGKEARLEAAIVGVQGESRWRQTFAFAYQGWGSYYRLHGNEHGLFVFSLIEVKAQLGVTVRGTQHSTWTGDYHGVADPDAGGRMVVNRYKNSSADFYWFDTTTGTFTPSAYVTAPPSGARVVDGAIVYVDLDTARLQVERAGGRTEVPLGVAPQPGGYAYDLGSSGPWVLFGSPPQAYKPTLKYNVKTGELTKLPGLEAPAGYLQPDFTNAWANIDGEGAIYGVFQSSQHPQVHQLFRSQDGATWQTLGKPFGGGASFKVTEQGGTYVFGSQGSGIKPHDAPEGVLWGAVTQLARPSAGVITILERWSSGFKGQNPLYADDTLSADGRCLAYWRDGSLHAVDVEAGLVTDLKMPGTQSSTVAAAWIAGP